MSFPRGRRFERIETALAGEDTVVFVWDTYHYHSFSNRAFELWQAANGERSEAELAVLVFGDSTPRSMDLVGAGLAALREAELLEGTEPAEGMSRRQATRLLAASVLAGIPAVASITAPVAADGLTPIPLPILFEGQRCAGDHRTGVCEPGACCLHNPNADIFGYCRWNGTYGNPCT